MVVRFTRLARAKRDLSGRFLTALRALINVHHSIYARVPPQGIYFEALVEKAFKTIKKPFAIIEGTKRNQPSHDLLVEDKKISLKTGSARLRLKSCVYSHLSDLRKTNQ